MNSLLSRGLAISFLFCSLAVAPAQPTGMLSVAEINRFGLERMWTAQVEVDVASGRVAHLSQHVSAKDSTTFFEVVHDKGKYVYGERDLDRYGRVIGKEQAEKLAKLKLSDLQKRNINAKLNTQIVPRITLYTVTGAGVVQAIDAETGRTLWKTAVGKAKYPTEAAGASDDYVAAVNGTGIYLLKATTGELVWERGVSGVPGAGPIVSDHLVFVPMINGAMEAHPLDDPRKPPIIYRSHGRALFQPIYTGSNVAWPTDKGHLYVSGGSQHRVSFRLEANAPIAAPCSIMPPNMIVATSIDGFVYCIQETSGALQWRFSSGEPILTSPVAYGDTVYATTTDDTLYAIDGSIGQERWSMPHISRVIGASVHRLFCLNDRGQLEILDRKSGSRLGTLQSQLADLAYQNKETDRVILATAHGALQCLRESGQEYPLLHIPITKSAEPTPKRAIPSAKPATPATTDGSPFESTPAGAKPAPEPGGADPFGGGAGGDKPGDKGGEKPAEKKSGDDPFGG